ncbi:MAG: bifunctional hydroxymethylpyrimidine kinase/phosphomethylpyrimidine kinase, partial [Pseudolabrys sp.]|nr:bifunctional hydroxymethylpyrimidine kinase/phosphomethylpyrimidine kinase [Pseudolabrys sp.]
QILEMGARYVLIKGGHGEDSDSVDLLIGGGDVLRLSTARIQTKNTHGTGCTLSAALAAGLAKGMKLSDAAIAAKEYVTAAIAAAVDLKIGSGHGPLQHFPAHWRAT